MSQASLGTLPFPYTTLTPPWRLFFFNCYTTVHPQPLTMQNVGQAMPDRPYKLVKQSPTTPYVSHRGSRAAVAKYAYPATHFVAN